MSRRFDLSQSCPARQRPSRHRRQLPIQYLRNRARRPFSNVAKVMAVGRPREDNLRDSMSTPRRAKFTEADAKRLFRAAAKAGLNVRVEFRLDGTIVAFTDNTTTAATINNPNELDEWMKNHHADPS
jgi:hypothetical protein